MAGAARDSRGADDGRITLLLHQVHPRDVHRIRDRAAANQIGSSAEGGAGACGVAGDPDRRVSPTANTLYTEGGRVAGAEDLRLQTS